MTPEITLTITICARGNSADTVSTEVRLNSFAEPARALQNMADDAVRRALAGHLPMLPQKEVLGEAIQ